MKLIFEQYDIEFTEKDITYANEINKQLQEKQTKIMNFFNLKKLSKNLKIKIWDNIDEYRNFFNQRMKNTNRKVNNWEVGRTTYNLNECRIDILNLNERKKCEGHYEDTIDKLLDVVIHEFVHVCQLDYSNPEWPMTWFLEALATNLSNQFDSLDINCSIGDIMNGKAHYKNYYAMGRYLLDNYDKNTILKLSKNNELLKEETPKIFYNTLEYIENNKTPSKNMV